MNTLLYSTRRVGLCLALTAGSAQAGVIDFTKAADWSGAAGSASYQSPTTFSGVTVTISSTGGNLTFNGGGDIHPLCGVTTGLVCEGDGIGIVDDEVSVGEVELLTVTFNTPVRFNSFGFLDLYYDCATGTCDDEDSPEILMWFYGAGPAGGMITAPSTNINNTDPGWVQTSLHGAGAGYYTSVTFFSKNPAPPNTDFALAKIDFDVPEPSSLLLLGMGLISLGGAARRRARR